MTDTSIDVRFFDVILCISRALDLLSPEISDHHLRVAYVAVRIAEEMGFDLAAKQDVVVAGALHDVGAVSSALRMSLQDYSRAGGAGEGGVLDDVHRHGYDGYLLLRDFPPFAQAADAVRYHHVEWNFKRGSEFAGAPVPLGSHILHLADRIAVLPRARQNVLEQSDVISRKAMQDKHRRYHPGVAEAFGNVAASEAFWLDLVSPHKEEIIRARFGHHNMVLGLDELYELAKLFARIIDFRSPYTAIHSSMVAARSQHIAQLLGMPPRQTRLIGIAGFLHDLGKLAVPAEILDKPARLTPAEMFVVKQHPYYTHRILSLVPGLEEVNTYASMHHERLDGGGYPFRHRMIPLGARIIAVADVLTAISEERPYRRGMKRTEALAVLDGFVKDGALDGEIVSLVRVHFEELIASRQG
ncbi:MAG TPA: HD domain-containing phosphohydrolase [Noviherbaspirillum sp.]|uniref:HD-GYP domain-containing protein n=1 Tax=Noviherbaspirillum sp. TaxID=1926288 RepID=UPI002D50BC9F|nr:HD domain-containing phosphohydrolase [Noviherbaspirillum sp.]HYD94597.1 HD domain-containing phosphohydrolase [Noviherbaspirillum sp.]